VLVSSSCRLITQSHDEYVIVSMLASIPLLSPYESPTDATLTDDRHVSTSLSPTLPDTGCSSSPLPCKGR
jgi:hypothetical protein